MEHPNIETKRTNMCFVNVGGFGEQMNLGERLGAGPGEPKGA